MYDRPLVFEDPLAVTILGEQYRGELDKTPRRPDRPFSTALRAFLVARSRFAEDTLTGEVAKGTRQYVLLGAGLDTFGCRNPYPSLQVFEVDHPATQAWKQEMLANSGIPKPDSLKYVPVDFEVDSLPERLAASGFDAARPALFAWLGVVPYVTLAAFRTTLRFISRTQRGTALVMDYGQPREVLSPHEQLAHDSLAARVQLSGEPFQLFLTTEQMRRELGAFSRVEDIGSTEINQLYFHGREDQLRSRGVAVRLVRCWV